MDVVIGRLSFCVIFIELIYEEVMSFDERRDAKR